jgi:methionine-rich copper-binding protein CopC
LGYILHRVKDYHFIDPTMKLSNRAWAFLFALSVAAPLSAAHAHPRLLKATPAADSRSAEAPREIALTFNESLDVALTRVTLLRGDTQVRADSLHLAAGDDKTVVVSLGEALAPGSYTVRWQVTGDDGHPVRGEFKFEVLATRVGTPQTTRP